MNIRPGQTFLTTNLALQKDEQVKHGSAVFAAAGNDDGGEGCVGKILWWRLREIRHWLTSPRP